MAGIKRSKNQLRREKAKQQKTGGHRQEAATKDGQTVKNGDIKLEPSQITKSDEVKDTSVLIKAELKPEHSDPLNTEDNTELLEKFKDVFNRFSVEKEEEEEEGSQLVVREEVVFSDSSDEESDSESEDQPLSKKQSRLQNKIPLSLLKASTTQPQLVDWFDADAKDPYLLVALKSQLNVIQVPAHWSAKRDYLSSRKGFEKAPFQLPKFIKDTGIEEMRNVSANDDQTLKQSQRDKVQVKMGKLDIDYQRLYNAFFKYQDKPSVSGFGEIYFEGKDIEEHSDKLTHIRPGAVSSTLRKALGMPENDLSVPPPWLLIMQQLGKPPSYQTLVIPGLDADYTNDGYREKNSKKLKNQKREYWGKFQENVVSSDEESEEEIEESDAETDAEQEDGTELEPAEEDSDEPVRVPISEVGKRLPLQNSAATVTSSDTPRSLYTVLSENNQESSGGLLSSKHAYDISKGTKDQKKVVEHTSTPQDDSVKPTSFKF